MAVSLGEEQPWIQNHGECNRKPLPKKSGHLTDSKEIESMEDHDCLYPEQTRLLKKELILFLHFFICVLCISIHFLV